MKKRWRLFSLLLLLMMVVGITSIANADESPVPAQVESSANQDEQDSSKAAESSSDETDNNATDEAGEMEKVNDQNSKTAPEDSIADNKQTNGQNFPPVPDTSPAVDPAPTQAVAWPTEFAIWTEGLREDGALDRNKYGFIINENHQIEEYANGSSKYLNFVILAHDEWTSSDKTQFYLVTKTGNSYSGQLLDSSRILVSKIEDYRRTSLWHVAVEMTGVDADTVQVCIFDDDVKYGFWKSNGVGDDKTYPYIISSPEIGWKDIEASTSTFSNKLLYAGVGGTVGVNGPKLQADKIASFDNAKLNDSLSATFSKQEVIGNQLLTSFRILTNPDNLLDTVIGLVPENDSVYGIPVRLTVEYPSNPVTVDFIYGGAGSIKLALDTFAKEPIVTKDSLNPDYLDLVKDKLSPDLTYAWYYSNSTDPNHLTSVASQFSDIKNAKGKLGEDWMSIDAKSDFGKVISQTTASGNTIYLQMRIYYADGSLATLTNPIALQAEMALLEVPSVINFGTIQSGDVINGSNHPSVDSDQQLKVTIPASSKSTWQVTAQVPVDGVFASLNAHLNIMGKDILPVPTILTRISSTGTTSYDLNSRLIFDSYNGHLAQSSYSETINWQLETETIPNVSQ